MNQLYMAIGMALCVNYNFVCYCLSLFVSASILELPMREVGIVF